MSGFDFATASLLVGVIYVVMPLITWFVLGEVRNLAATLWCVGGLFMGVSTVMVSIFPVSESSILALSIPTMLYFLAFTFRVQALRMDFQQPYSVRHIAIILLLVYTSFELLHHGVGLYIPRAMFASLAFALGAILVAHSAAEIGHREASNMARWISVAYGAAAIGFLLRILYLSQQDFARTEGSLVTDGIAATVAVLLTLLASVVGHFGYVGLFLERAQRRAVDAATEHARKDVSLQLGAQIAWMERRHSFGELTASISHELNQPLTAILTNAQVAKRGLQTGRMESAKVQQILERIEFNTLRATGILERIRNFMRAREVQRNPVDLREVVTSVMQIMDVELQRHWVRLVLELPQKPIVVSGDSLQLSQVLLNMLKNALDSMISAPSRVVIVKLVEGGGRVQLSVRDSGTGLNNEQKRMAGTPFFTTKPQGMGMGISISRTIARNHGGSLNLTNAEGESGAVAVLDLPLVSQHETR